MNVTAVVNTSGTVVERYAYDTYGQPEFYAEDWTSRSSSDYDQCILFAGYLYDPETGLYHVRNRMYHPTLGRWLQRDPIGYVDGMSLYEYVRSNPSTGLDPMGLTDDSVSLSLGGGAPSEAELRQIKASFEPVIKSSDFEFGTTYGGGPNKLHSLLRAEISVTHWEFKHKDRAIVKVSVVVRRARTKAAIDDWNAATAPDPRAAKHKWVGKIGGGKRTVYAPNVHAMMSDENTFGGYGENRDDIMAVVMRVNAKDWLVSTKWHPVDKADVAAHAKAKKAGAGRGWQLSLVDAAGADPLWLGLPRGESKGTAMLWLTYVEGPTTIGQYQISWERRAAEEPPCHELAVTAKRIKPATNPTWKTLRSEAWQGKFAKGRDTRELDLWKQATSQPTTEPTTESG